MWLLNKGRVVLEKYMKVNAWVSQGREWSREVYESLRGKSTESETRELCDCCLGNGRSRVCTSR